MIQNYQLEISECLPLKDVVFRKLRWAILKGELMPGERLLEVSLANQFSVSRTPVREAIRKLEVEGLAFMMPGRGAKVARIEEKDLQDVLEVRAFLEKDAIELACERMTLEWPMEFEAALDYFYQAVCSNDMEKIVENDMVFHNMIFEVTGNFLLIQTIDNLKEVMYRYRLEYLKGLSNYMQLYIEHCNIYEAMKKKDKALARELMNEHIYAQEQVLCIN